MAEKTPLERAEQSQKWMRFW